MRPILIHEYEFRSRTRSYLLVHEADQSVTVWDRESGANLGNYQWDGKELTGTGEVPQVRMPAVSELAAKWFPAPE